MATPSDERGLLLGLLAVQADLLAPAALREALSAWHAQETPSLPAWLVERGALSSPIRDALETMVDEYIRRHGNDPAAALASLPPDSRLRSALEGIAGFDALAPLTRRADHEVSTLAAPTLDAETARLRNAARTQTASRFRVLRAHAHGGLGEVYVAEDEELGRTVALKEMGAQVAGDESLRSRFILEAEITGNLEHPGIVPVYGLGLHADGRPFYAMRFIEGDSLKEAIDRYHKDLPGLDPTARSLRLRQMLGRFIDVCEAIAYAHSRGVLHRDLKPANVMLGKYGETLIVDWGLARVSGREESTPAGSGVGLLVLPSGSVHAPTVPGSALGTPQFMSPEQARGALDELGPASDVYGLGGILYALLTGKPPIAAAALAEILERVRAGAIVPPRLANRQAAIPPALEAICLKALAIRAEDRYPTARALSDDVEHWLADERVSAYPDPLATGVWRWLRKHRTLVATSAAAGLLGLVSLAAILAIQSRAKSAVEASLAREEAANRHLDAANTTLAVTNRELLLARDRAQQQYVLARDAIGAFHGDVTADVLLRNPELKPLRAKLLKSPLDFYSRLTEILDQSKGADPATGMELAGAWARLGDVTAQVGNKADALVAFERARAELDRLLTEGDRRPSVRYQRAVVGAEIGGLLHELGRDEPAHAALDDAQQRFSTYTAEHPDESAAVDKLSAVELNLGLVEATLGRLDHAIERTAAAVDRYREQLRSNPIAFVAQQRLAQGLGQLATCYRVRGDLARALELRRESATVWESIVARSEATDDHRSRLADALGQLAISLGDVGDFAGTLAAHERARAILTALLNTHPNQTDYAENLATLDLGAANAAVQLGQAEEAERLLTRSIAQSEAVLKDNPGLHELRYLLASSEALLGWQYSTSDPERTVELLGRGVARLREVVAAQPTDDRASQLAVFESMLSKTLLGLGRSQEADQSSSTALEQAEALVRKNPAQPMLAFGRDMAQVMRASVLLGYRRADEALALADRALAHVRTLSDANPGVVPFHDLLLEALSARIEALVAVDDVDAAMGTLGELRSRIDRDAPSLLDAAELLARLATNLGPERSVRGDRLVAETIALLRQAAELGPLDRANIEACPAFQALMAEPRFREFLLDSAFPVERPFTR